MKILKYPIVDEIPERCYDCIFFTHTLGLSDDQCMLLRKMMHYRDMYTRRHEDCPLNIE